MIRNISREDYLAAMFNIEENQEKNKEISSVEVARELNISKASVSQMMRKLYEEKFIDTTKYSKVKLTKKGRSTARKIVQKHRLIEYFLEKVLSCDKKNIHEEAHKLEHAFSDRTIKKLNGFLKKPNLCKKRKDRR